MFLLEYGMGPEQRPEQPTQQTRGFESTATAEQRKIAEALANPTLVGLAQLLQTWYIRLGEHYEVEGMEQEANLFRKVGDDFGDLAQELDGLGIDKTPIFGGRE
jgi:hypothetical protein